MGAITLNGVEECCSWIKQHLKKQPNAYSLDECQDYFNRMRYGSASLADAIGYLESEWAVFCHETIKEMPEEEWKKIKGSSTLTTVYIEGMHPRLANLRKLCKELRDLVKQSSDEIRTLISYRKQEMEMSLLTINQT